jgi:hypothetical protein
MPRAWQWEIRDFGPDHLTRPCRRLQVRVELTSGNYTLSQFSSRLIGRSEPSPFRILQREPQLFRELLH